MQISSNYNSLVNRIWQLYGTSGQTSQASTISSSSSSGSSDQLSLSDDYLSFHSFLDKVKNGTVTDDDLSKMQEEMSASQQMQMPPQPMQMSTTGSGEDSSAIGSFLDKVKNGTVTTDDLTNMESVLSTNSSSSNGTSVSSTDSSSQLTFQSFMDKVMNGTVTQDDLTQMQTQLQQAGQNGSGRVHHHHHSGSSDSSSSDSTNGVSSSSASTVSSASSDDDTDSLTLQSFLDKVKNGTVTDDDLTQMQTELKQMDSNASGVQSGFRMPPPPMGMMNFIGGSDSSSDSTSSSGSSGTDSLTLQSFLDKVKDGTVTDSDLTDMQSLLQNWMSADTSDDTSAYAQFGNL